nr:copia protein [Tanacetum cinerariifolium]
MKMEILLEPTSNKLMISLTYAGNPVKKILSKLNLSDHRLGHINFKTMNKLVRENLVRGLPSKLFKKDHTCVACQKKKQHKATWNQTNGNAGPKSSKDKVPDDARKKDNAISSSFTTVDPRRERPQRNELESLFGQDKDANGNNTYRMFTPLVEFLNDDFSPFVSFLYLFCPIKSRFPTVSDVVSSYVNLGESIPVNAATLPNVDLLIEPLIHDLEDAADLQDTRIFSGAYDDEVKGAVGDFNNLEPTIIFSLIPITRIHKDHPKEQIIGDLPSAPQTTRMTKTFQEHAMRQCKMSCYSLDCRRFGDWLIYPEASMPLEQNRSIEKKKDERGIVVRNKARLVAQGHTQEEGIDYDEVFVHVARIEAIRLFLAYASFMGFIVYQMDVKSDFLYGIIEEEVYVCQPPSLKIYSSMTRFQVTPKVSHLHAVERIFRYLKGQPKLGLWYPKDSPFDLEAFLECDYAGASLDGKSTTRGCQFLSKRLIYGNFWATARSKTVNDVKQIHATVDGKIVVISKSSVRSDLYFNDEDGITCLSNDKNFVNLALMRVVRVATTTTSLEAEQESGNINKTQSTKTLNESSPQGVGSSSGPRCQDTTLGDAYAQTRFETASKQSHDPPFSKVNTSRSEEDDMEHQDDLTDFIPPTPYDLSLLGGHTPGSDEVRPNITELIAICTQLLKKGSCIGTIKDCSRLGDQKAAKASQNIGKEAKGKKSRDESLQD